MTKKINIEWVDNLFYLFATISSSEEKNFYIKNHNLNQNINNITEEGKAIEKKLVSICITILVLITEI